MVKWLQKQLTRRFRIERLELGCGNEMWRLCVWGYHEYRWFARLDCGSVGWRLTRRPRPEHKMEPAVLPPRTGPKAPWRR